MDRDELAPRPPSRRYVWNSVALAGGAPDDVRELVDASYGAAVAALPKSRRPAAPAG